jgi:hypothetical protein
MPSNSATAIDDDGEFSDWIELHNNSSQPIQLDGWKVSDKPDLSSAWIFPSDAVIEAGAYILLWASGVCIQTHGVTGRYH